jgi:hypothetical protein
MVWAQGGATAQMYGVVRDTSGAVVPGAEVKATQTDTSVARTTTSGADGSYVLTTLPVGPYRLEVSKGGFTTHVQTGIVLQVGSAPAIDVTLSVGTASQQVTVEASAIMVETRSLSVGQLVETERILELPLNGRQVTDLIALSGGAVQNAGATGVTRTITGPPIISLAGGLSYSVGYLLDGANYYNYASGSTNLMPFPDALQEFKVDTSGMNSQQGSYAQVSAVTRAGTNAFHGDLFEFVRNEIFNARNFYAPVRDNLKRNQFGGVIGGPLRKDKLFFFAGYQGTLTRSNNPVNQALLPTPAMLSGDWSTFASPACNGGRQLTLGAPYGAGNTINPALFSPVALNIMNRIIATAPTPDSCGNVRYAQPVSVNDHEFLGRLDDQATSKNSIFARYFAVRHTARPPTSLTSDLLAVNTGEDDLMQSGVLGDTYLISSNIVNSFRLSTTRLWYQNTEGPWFNGCDAGMNVHCYYPGMALALSGVFSLGLNLGDGAYVENQNFNLNEDLTIVHGAHQFSFGADLGLDYMHQHDNFFGKGLLVGSSFFTGTTMSDFMIGDAQAFTQSAPYYDAIRMWHWNLYATDTWKVTPRVTVTYGVRWEPFTPETLINAGGVASFDYARFLAGTRSQKFPTAPPGFMYQGDPGYPNGKTGMLNHWDQWAPHVGIAWDPTGDGRTSLRASWGLSYDQVGGHIHDDMSQQAPFYNTTSASLVPAYRPGTSFPIPFGGITNPWASFAGIGVGTATPCVPAGQFPGANFPFPYTVGTVPSCDLAFSGMAYNIKEPYTSAWNLSLQRQIGTSWMFSASYIGSETTHMWSEQPLNYVSCTPAQITSRACSIPTENNFRVLNMQYPGLSASNIMYVNATNTANYNGLLLTVQHRVSHNFSLQSNYTWSHCISDFDPDPTMQAGEDDFMWSNPLNRKADRGNCNADRRNAFNLTGVALAPNFGNHVWGRLASNWQIAPIFTRSSGQPIDVVLGGDPALNGSWDPIKGSFFQRPNCVPGVNPYGSSAPGGQYLNLAAFSMPAPGTLGNCPYNGLHGPAYWSFDMALSRNFKIREGQHIEIRAEAFNVLNLFRPGTCNPLGSGCQFLAGTYLGQTSFSGAFTTLTNPATFGRINVAMDPRIMQFAMKYMF